MKSLALTFAAMAMLAPGSLAIPPAEFGFPETANHTELSIAYTFQSNTTVVQEAQLFGGNITSQQPVLAVDPNRFQSIASYSGSYLVVMIDPDAVSPDNPTVRSVLHWLAPNMTATTPATGPLTGQRRLTNTTVAIAEYRPPGPPATSSAHRYIIYAFQQPSNFTMPAAFRGFNDTNRIRFDIDAFVTAAGLGAPAAANYMYVSRQPSVPGTFIALAGGEYPGGNGNAIFAGVSTQPTATTTGSTGSGTPTPTGGAAKARDQIAGALGAAGLLGLLAML